MSRDPELDRALAEAWQSVENQAAQEVARPRIAERVAVMLPAHLAPAVLERERLGLLKYGQYLDANHQPLKARIVHLIQELLDGANYSVWAAQDCRGPLAWLLLGTAWLLIRLVILLAWLGQVSAQEMIEGGKR